MLCVVPALHPWTEFVGKYFISVETGADHLPVGFFLDGEGRGL